MQCRDAVDAHHALDMGMGWLREQRQREPAPFVLAIERNRVFEVNADDIGAGIERLRVAVGTQAGDEQQTAAWTDGAVWNIHLGFLHLPHDYGGNTWLVMINMSF